MGKRLGSVGFGNSVRVCSGPPQQFRACAYTQCCALLEVSAGAGLCIRVLTCSRTVCFMGCMGEYEFATTCALASQRRPLTAPQPVAHGKHACER
eukprot:5182243-Alexandrium_andersonii.AAC.1